jgi:hypothetical protein
VLLHRRHRQAGKAQRRDMHPRFRPWWRGGLHGSDVLRAWRGWRLRRVPRLSRHNVAEALLVHIRSQRGEIHLVQDQDAADHRDGPHTEDRGMGGKLPGDRRKRRSAKNSVKFPLADSPLAYRALLTA